MRGWKGERLIVHKLGCRVVREHQKRLTVNFFGHQIVTHLETNGAFPSTAIYPRRFGVVFHRREDFELLVAHLVRNKIVIIGGPRENKVYITDPSNNVVKFKCRR